MKKKTSELYKELNITNTFYSRFMKRFIDFFISLVGILVLSPIYIIVALLTLIFNGWPIFYKQARPGKNRKIFYIYKFRSMNNKKDENGNLLPDEQRITKFGKFIRKTSIDELPQLFNILRGDMSIVGPRPRLIKDMMFYDEEVMKFYVIRPGLTGPTQTTGRNANTWEQVFEKDIAYTHKITFWGDVKIFIKTFTSVFSSTGETHTNAEEDKTAPKVKDQEYYYADYIKRIGKISEEQYQHGLKLSKEIVETKEQINFHPELHDQELFDKMMGKTTEEKTEKKPKEKVDAETKKEKTDTKATKKSKNKN
jgi:lipopolysaccharide/colanic/teichoic acid biosynthesis glycosyltransferase